MAIQITPNDLQRLEDTLLNTLGNVSLHKRFRALFTLKALNNDDAVRIISKGFSDSSALLKHELAYCLGQMKQTTALPALESVLRDVSEDPMAAEAMGAISSIDSMPVLKDFLFDSERTVRETCEIAIARIEWDASEEASKYHSDVSSESHIPLYTSIDPAPAASGLLRGAKPDESSPSNVATLREQLINKNLPLFQRYRAMFALRNIGTAGAVDALASGFSDDSALFKHEIAFVFGQMLSPHSVSPLLKVLQNTDENEMVRHEAAEALGGIGTSEVLPYLREWMTRADAPRVVRESCQVAIDIWEYGNSGEFHLMPLDGHSYLVAQGWSGKGNGLREGSIARPLAIPQKRTLAGVGKDRDEAFPFWDHLFSAAAKSIQLKVYNSDSEDEKSSDASRDNVDAPILSRTSTGILSNRRPGAVASVETSGTTTPVASETKPQYGLLITAKREAAKQNLYSRFFRGPVLGPDADLDANLPPKDGSEHVSVSVSSDFLPQRKRNQGTAEGREQRKRRKGEEKRAKERRRKRKESESCIESKKSKRKRKEDPEDTFISP
ncbi:hypothetical protein APHAL10511_002617 [Amanita phalloides]|nr:hypothetical protein APHAL10511_002617 [Amanita phalloides]